MERWLLPSILLRVTAAVLIAIVALVCAILLLRFAERVDTSALSPTERTMWLIALAVLAALSVLSGKWLYAGVYAVALAGVATAQSWW